MDKVKTKNFFSIEKKITLSILLCVIISISVVFFASYINTKKIMREAIELRLLNMVNIAVLQVDADRHATLKTPDDQDSENYKDIKQTLQNIKNNSTDINYIYTFRETEEGKIAFIVDAENDPSEVSNLGDIYEEPNQFLIDNFKSMDKPMAEKEFTSDKWGTWISGFAPFYDSNGKRDGVLGIDIKASHIIEKEKDMVEVYLVLFLFSVIFSVILGLYISRKLIKSISSIASVLVNHEDETSLPFANDEVGVLAGALKAKMNQLSEDKKTNEDKATEKTRALEKMNQLMIGRELEMIKLKKENAQLKNKLETE